MKILQKIAAILYSVWAVYRSYITIMSIIYYTSKVTVTMDGVKYSMSWDNISVLTILSFLVPLSFITLSVFLIYNAFSKKHSFKKQIISIVWLGVNTAILVFIPQMSYVVYEMTTIITLFNISNNTQPLFLILSFLLSKYALVVISLINIIAISLKIGGIFREKV
ncbi:MAG: hypothetical protein IJY79_02460 [Clostridia bacterium]|nr:hypothetical protein [Clostridia bacterium]